MCGIRGPVAGGVPEPNGCDGRHQHFRTLPVNGHSAKRLPDSRNGGGRADPPARRAVVAGQWRPRRWGAGSPRLPAGPARVGHPEAGAEGVLAAGEVTAAGAPGLRELVMRLREMPIVW